ncbi:restriction endonuclease subunit S [Croceivirga radicis]|uniref:restriction endonuclease subunit S n=1 Tax=Croceivirga radicis TaxID=1929488 RepID=UPI000255B196|nr:restriction endonuclease subunit S [Croceivirga radicis]
MSKNKLIPELRFPEFINYGKWLEKKLGQVGEPLMCKRIFKDQTTPNPENGIPFYKIGTFGKEPDSYITLELYEEFKAKYNFPKKGDILISASGTIGRLVVYDGEPAYFQDSNIVWLGHDGKEVSNDFLYYCYSIVSWQTSDGGIIKRLYNSDLKAISINFPENEIEQQKIATCLSSLDELIAAHNDKLDALKEHKKGLMQNLFPQEGQKVPNYRFPEFENDGEWNKMELGDLVSIKGRIGYRGYTKDDIVAQGNGAISMSPSNISDNGSLSFEKSTYITWDKYYESPEIMLEDGFTVLVKTGSTFGKVAHISNLKEKTTINPQLVVLKPNEIDKYFLYLIVSNTSVQKQIVATVVGGAIPTLSQDSISKFEVMVPREKEQQKIASCLLALDELISILSNRIEELQQHKKGLMQGLFPKIES